MNIVSLVISPFILAAHVWRRVNKKLDDDILPPVKWVYEYGDVWPNLDVFRPLLIWFQIPFSYYLQDVRPRIREADRRKFFSDSWCFDEAVRRNDPSLYKPRALKRKIRFWWHRNITEARKMLGLPYEPFPKKMLKYGVNS